MAQHREWLSGFGARLREERQQQKLTRIMLADKVGTKQDYIAQMERGDKSPSLDTLIRILSALDISADALIFGVTDKKLNAVDNVLTELTELLKRKSVEEISAYCNMIKYMSKQFDVKMIKT